MAVRRSDLEQTPLDPETAGSLKENREWVKILNQEIHYGGGALKGIPTTIKRVIREGMWKRFLIGIEIVEFDSFEDFVTTKAPYGIDITVDQLKALCEKDLEAIKLIDKEITRKPGGQEGNTNNRFSKDEDTNNDNIMIRSLETKATQGTSIEYTLRRLEKENPELLQRVINKEMSPNQAAIEAGFRKKTVTITVDVEAIARKLKKLLTPEQITTLKDLL